MNINFALSVVALPAGLSACGTWPHDKQWLVDNFHENRQEIEALEDRFGHLQYDEVVMSNNRQLIGYRYEVDGGMEGAPNIQSEKILGSNDWSRLFEQAKIKSITFNDLHGVSLKIDQAVLGGPSRLASYESGDLVQSELLSCDRAMAELRCGFCKIDLNDNWWVRFGWRPRDLFDATTLALQNGDLTMQEHSVETAKIFTKCLHEGSTSIG